MKSYGWVKIGLMVCVALLVGSGGWVFGQRVVQECTTLTVFERAHIKALTLGGDPFTGVAGTAVTSSAAELNILDGVTSTAEELNTVDLSAVGAAVKIKKISISANFNDAEQSTGWALPAKAVVLDVFLDVTTADTGETLDVGTATAGGGDPNGWLALASVNGTGLVRGVATLTAGGNETYFASTTRGALLAALTAGADVAGDVGTYYEKYDAASGGKTVVYTGSNGTSNTMRGAIYILYIELG